MFAFRASIGCASLQKPLDAQSIPDRRRVVFEAKNLTDVEPCLSSRRCTDIRVPLNKKWKIFDHISTEAAMKGLLPLLGGCEASFRLRCLGLDDGILFDVAARGKRKLAFED